MTLSGPAAASALHALVTSIGGRSAAEIVEHAAQLERYRADVRLALFLTPEGRDAFLEVRSTFPEVLIALEVPPN